ncbi:MAG: hypothetical protein JXA67_12225, partial [Micromonosporaceae bacterium]|nr:hypothetical protein [Micromonosporaceae bacterium]
SLVQSTLALTVIVVYAVAGWNPTVTMFYWLGTTGGLGVLLLIAATSIAVIAFFAHHPGREPLWRRLLVPLLATAALGVVVVLAVRNIATLLGVTGDHPLTWIVPTGYLVAALLGAAWGLVLKTSQPEVYARIGLGAKAAVATISPPGGPATLPPPRHSSGSSTPSATRGAYPEQPARPAHPDQPARSANGARGFGAEADR